MRRIIGGLMGVYGALLVVLGLFDTDAEIEKAQGVHINLWAGIGMLVLSALFWAWALWRPLGEELQEDESGGPPDAPPPRGVDAAALASAAERARQGRVRRGRGGAD